MPSDPPTIARIEASINGGEYSPIELQCNLSVNTFPSLVATVAPDADGDISVKAPVSQEVLGRIARLQAARLAGRSEPDMEVEATDGIGGSLSYRGFVSAPVLDVTTASTGDQLSSVGRAAYLDALDLSIYRAGYEAARPETEDGLGPIPAATGDLAASMAAVTKALVDNYDNTLASEPEQIARDMLELQHGINQGGPLGIWEEMLGDSDVSFEAWSDMIDLHPAVGAHIADSIRHAITSSTPGFWNKLRSLMGAFQMFYIPSMSGAGRLARNDAKVGEPTVSVEVSARGLGVSDGSPRILQPGGVAMVGASLPSSRPETDYGLEQRVFAFAPSPLLPGFIQRENIPFWLLRPGGIPVLGSEIDAGASGSKNLSLPDRADRIEKGAEFEDKIAVASRGVMTEMCEVIFKDIQLEHSTASATIPLSFGAGDLVGQRATVRVRGEGGDGGGSFTAFVAGVTHSVQLTRGKEMNSFTKLHLTHAKF